MSETGHLTWQDVCDWMKEVDHPRIAAPILSAAVDVAFSDSVLNDIDLWNPDVTRNAFRAIYLLASSNESLAKQLVQAAYGQWVERLSYAILQQEEHLEDMLADDEALRLIICKRLSLKADAEWNQTFMLDHPSASGEFEQSEGLCRPGWTAARFALHNDHPEVTQHYAHTRIVAPAEMVMLSTLSGMRGEGPVVKKCMERFLRAKGCQPHPHVSGPGSHKKMQTADGRSFHLDYRGKEVDQNSLKAIRKVMDYPSLGALKNDIITNCKK